MSVLLRHCNVLYTNMKATGGVRGYSIRADARSRSHTPAFESSGVLFHIPGSPGPSLEILRIPKG